MRAEQLSKIFKFLEEKEQHKVPFIIKVKCEIPLTKEELIVKGNLNLKGSKITSLPEGLEVHHSLFIKNIALLEYTDGELKKMVKPGFIKGKIYR